MLEVVATLMGFGKAVHAYVSKLVRFTKRETYQWVGGRSIYNIIRESNSFSGMPVGINTMRDLLTNLLGLAAGIEGDSTVALLSEGYTLVIVL